MLREEGLEPMVSLSLSITFSLYGVHMSWILLMMATIEDNINQKKCKEL